MTSDDLPAEQPPAGQFLLYRTEDGQTRVECRFAGESIWLTQRLMAELFQTSVPNITQHLKTIYEDRELVREATIKKYLIVQAEGNRQVSRLVDHYNLDDFLKLSDREILDHAGRISHEQAKEKAEAEYEIYRQRQAALPQPMDEHFDRSLEELKQIEKRKKKDEDTDSW